MKRIVAVMIVLGAMLSAHPADALTISIGLGTTTTTTKPKVPAACSAGYVNMSFDDSPTQYTPVILAALKKDSLKATFFDVGDRMVQYPTYAKTQFSAGMQVENHTQYHGDLTVAESPTHDLVTTQYSLIQATGQIPTFYRPPYGATNTEVSGKAHELGLTEVIWTVDTVDWSGVSTASIVASAATVQPGGFILMHDGYANTISAIPGIAAMLKTRGLCAGKIVTSTTPTVAWEGLSFPATVAKF
jgi:peptidoglycan/xylan/chitin deacetylase (PgdA/CDA1 family)